MRRGRAALETPGGRYSQNVLPLRSEPIRMCRRQGRRRDFQRAQRDGEGLDIVGMKMMWEVDERRVVEYAGRESLGAISSSLN
jgi:hypothetical protein